MIYSIAIEKEGLGLSVTVFKCILLAVAADSLCCIEFYAFHR